MPDMELEAREQDAVLWPFLRPDQRGGAVVDVPVSLDAASGAGVRWKWNYTEMLDPQRATVTVDATVVVDREVPVDSLIWLGNIKDLDDPTLGPGDQGLTGVCQVKAFTHTSDLKNHAVRRKLGVVRFRGALPTGVG